MATHYWPVVTPVNYVNCYVTTNATSSTAWSVRYNLNDWGIVYYEPFIAAAPAIVHPPGGQLDPDDLEHELRALQNQAVGNLYAAAEHLQLRLDARAAASQRARQLLLGELDPVQRAQFEAEGHFIVRGRRGRSYRIRRGISGNIDMLQRGRVISRLCVHPHGAHAMPPEDVMLAQLLHLRDDERGVLQVANRHP